MSEPRDIPGEIRAICYHERALAVHVVCRYCTGSWGQFTNERAARRAGWRDLRADDPSPAHKWTHTGICTMPLCRTHPERHP